MRSSHPSWPRRVVVVVAALAARAAWATDEAPSEDAAYLGVTTHPVGVMLYIDDREAGETPTELIPVAPGEHELWFRSLAPALFEPQPVPVRRVSIAAGDTLRIAETVGVICFVSSDPPGASVLAGNEVIGTTPVAIRWGRDETEEVHVVSASRRTAVIEPQTLMAGGPIHVVLDPSAEPLTTVPEPERKSPPKWLPWGVLAASGASAGLAVYLKDIANEAFDAYESAAIPADMRRAIHRADRYDRFSTAAWIGAEAGIVAVFWLLREQITIRDDDGIQLRATPNAVGVEIPWR